MVDLIVIGGGPAGYHGALCAAKRGLRTVLISDGAPGGVCLHSGCIPSKTVLHSTKLSADHADFAIYGGPHPVDLPVLRERIGGIISLLERGITGQLARSGVTVIDDRAEILPKREPYFAVKAGSEVLMSRFLLLASGSEERRSEIPGIEKAPTVTIRELLDHENVPQSLLIIGGGSMGVEIGSAFARMGTEVTIVETRERICSAFDPDLTRILEKELEKLGITIFTGAQVKRIHHHTAEIVQGEHHFSISAERILPALGRTPMTEIPGISELAVKLNERGAVQVSSLGETSHSRCYAAGDTTGEPMLAHTAYSESERAVRHMAGESVSENRPLIPMVLYSSPELASVGLSEQDAADQGAAVIVKKRPLGGNGRFLAETSGERGLCKVVLSKDNGTILGVHLAAPYASELIVSASLMITQKLTARDLAEIIFPHPTIGEILKECITEEI